MDLRLCFENKAGVNIDDKSVFQHYAANYLAGFAVQWAGSIMISHTDRRTRSMEPVWQYLIRDASTACRDYLCEYLSRNPMCGYFVHVYQLDPGTPPTRVYSSDR